MFRRILSIRKVEKNNQECLGEAPVPVEAGNLNFEVVLVLQEMTDIMATRAYA